MKIIAILGSPRRGGTSDCLLEEFLIGVKKAHGDFEKIVLADFNINPCREDHACAKTGECSIADDAPGLFQKILAAEKIVMASPVFFYSLPGRLKALVDRVELYWMRKLVLKQPPPGPDRKVFILMAGATAGEKMFEGCLLTLQHFFMILNGSIAGSLLYRSLEKPEDLARRPEISAEVRRAGSNFAEA